MQKYEGKSVFNGIAIGKAFIFRKNEGQVRRKHITDINAEIIRLDEAREKAKEDRTDPVAAANKLRGTYEGKKLLKIPVSGTQVTICAEHIQKFAEQTREGV